ncbi:unnamed protein product [Rhizoctonia solani]|uniref:Uncharacterized protein n=1 Tax=Rhizoctonia solani TaxID=456999 RepID=A0A8H2XMA2_9AGAM|nr:unnamed protein product [Rhizoctonia solani]
MYSRASRYQLEALATSIRSSNPAVRFRSFGSTTCIQSAAVSQKISGVWRNPGIFPPATSEHSTPSPPEQGRADPGLRSHGRYTYPRYSESRSPPREVHIAIKVKGLCRAGQFEEAVDVCMNTPVALQGATAWNTIIHHALSGGRYNYAYSLYQQMKKRSIKPTVSTYTTFMSAYAQAKPEILTSIQLGRAQQLYKDWISLVMSARTDKAVAAITSVHPAAAYINVLANAKLYQSIWDTFYDLNLEGPLAPNQFVFTNMFVAFAKRATLPNSTAISSDSIPDEAGEATPALSNIRLKNAQDARVLWRMVLRSLERQPFPIDSYLVVAVLRALQHGEQLELDLALKIIDEYLGLRAPDAPALSELNKPLELNSRLLGSALSVCNAANRPDLTRHFLDIMTTPGHPDRALVNTGAMNILIEAYASLGDRHQMIQTIDWMIRESALPGGLEVAPGNSSWCIALRACLAAQDWDAAKTLTKRLASITTGKRRIDAETIYLVLKITYALKPVDERLHERQLRQALDAVYYVVSVWPKDPNAVQESHSEPNPGKMERRSVFQNALGDLVKKILNEFDGLRSIAGFNDLTYRLDQLQTHIPPEITARYQQDF